LLWCRLQGSRPHYCINKAVIRTGNIDGECEKLLKEEERGCSYKKAAATITHGLVRVSFEGAAAAAVIAAPAGATAWLNAQYTRSTRSISGISTVACVVPRQLRLVYSFAVIHQQPGCA
jgi:hypothetical protein